MVVDAYVVYQFVKRIATPFRNWPAYKHGIIDERGRVLRPRRTLKNQEEKLAWTLMDTLCANLKKLLEKVPGGATRVGSLAAAAWMLKEEDDAVQDSMELMLSEDAPTNNSGGGQVADFDDPVKGTRKRKRGTYKRATHLLKRVPFTNDPLVPVTDPMKFNKGGKT